MFSLTCDGFWALSSRLVNYHCNDEQNDRSDVTRSSRSGRHIQVTGCSARLFVWNIQMLIDTGLLHHMVAVVCRAVESGVV